MKRNPNRPVRTLSSQLIWLSLAVTMLALDLFVGLVVREDFLTGRTYSLLVVFNSGALVDKHKSPMEYWALMGFYTLGFVMFLAIVIQQLFEIAAEEKRRKNKPKGP